VCPFPSTTHALFCPPGCGSFPFLTINYTAHSIFVFQRVRPSLFSQLNTMLTPFSSSSVCVHPFSCNSLLTPFSSSRKCVHLFSRNSIHCSLHFRLPACSSFPFLAIQSTAHSIFVFQRVRPSLFSQFNPLLTPFSSPRKCVHLFSHNSIHCSLHFRLPGSASFPFLAIQSSAHSIFVSQEVRPSLFLPFNPLLTPVSSPRKCVLPFSCN